jgi:hypothetical protein
LCLLDVQLNNSSHRYAGIISRFFYATPQSIAAADDEESLNLSQADLPPKGNPKLDSALNGLVADEADRESGKDMKISDNTSPPETMIMEAHPESVDETVRVIIESAPGKGKKISTTAGDFGSFEGRYGDLVQMVVPVAQLTALAETQGVRFVRLPMRPLVGLSLIV